VIHHTNNNNSFSGELAKKTWVNWYQKKHSAFYHFLVLRANEDPVILLYSVDAVGYLKGKA